MEFYKYLPLVRSGPEQVREYLANLLLTKHDIAIGSAIEVTNGWKLGRGSDLRTSSTDFFQKLFGEEFGY